MAINEEMALKEGLKVLRQYAWFDFTDDEVSVRQLKNHRLDPSSELINDYFEVEIEKPWIVKPNIMSKVGVNIDPDSGFAVYLYDTADSRPNFYLLEPDGDKYKFKNCNFL